MGSISADIAAAEGKPLEVLSDRQRQAYELRLEKKTYSQIAKELGVTPNAVYVLIHSSLRRFREYEQYHSGILRNSEPVEFPVTRGELLFMLRGLILLKDAQKKAAAGYSPRAIDWPGRMSYEHTCVSSLIDRVRSVLYKEQEESGAETSSSGEPV